MGYCDNIIQSPPCSVQCSCVSVEWILFAIVLPFYPHMFLYYQSKISLIIEICFSHTDVSPTCLLLQVALAIVSATAWFDRFGFGCQEGAGEEITERKCRYARKYYPTNPLHVWARPSRCCFFWGVESGLFITCHPSVCKSGFATGCWGAGIVEQYDQKYHGWIMWFSSLTEQLCLFVLVSCTLTSPL